MIAHTHTHTDAQIHPPTQTPPFTHTHTHTHTYTHTQHTQHTQTHAPPHTHTRTCAGHDYSCADEGCYLLMQLKAQKLPRPGRNFAILHKLRRPGRGKDRPLKLKHTAVRAAMAAPVIRPRFAARAFNRTAKVAIFGGFPNSSEFHAAC